MNSYSRSFSAFLLGAVLLTAPLLPRANAQTSPSAALLPAQTSRLPLLTLSSSVLPDGVGALTLRLPASTSLPDKVRVALYENGGFARVADVKRRFERVGDALQTVVNVQNASPGRYEMRVLSDNRERVLLAAPAPLLVPGIEREPGWWLFNGSPLILQDNKLSAGSFESLPDDVPLFLPGLRRDTSKKAKAPTRDYATGVPPTFRVFGVRGQELTSTPFDAAAFAARLTQELKSARASGQRNYAGLFLRLDAISSASAAFAPKARLAVERLRAARDAVAPDAPIVLQVSDVAPSVLDACLPLCDAVQLFGNNDFALKIARRNAEEQPNYDLPIWAEVKNPPDAANALLSGATGLIGNAGDLEPVLKRNLSLFVNSVTLEDVGVLPLGSDQTASQIAARLRLAGRVPQLSRAVTDDYKTPEAFYARLDENTTSSQLESLLRTARAGGRVYLEGSLAPSSPLTSQLRELGGGTLTAREPREVAMKLDDPWIFGTLHGSTLPVMQRATVTLSASTMGKQASKPEEGLDKLIEPRVVATLDDGTPGMILNPVGKGQVMWMPHAFATSRSAGQFVFPDAPVGANGELRAYDTAMSGYLSPALARLRAVETPNKASQSVASGEVSGGVAALRVSVRRSPKGALLVALTNTSGSAVATQIAVDGAPEFCQDLVQERALPVTRRGFEGRTNVTVPANGYALLAFHSDRKTFDAERAAPRLKAKLR